MNSRGLFSLLLLLTAIVTSPGAGDTNQPASVTRQHGGFHQKIPWAVGFGMEGTVTNVALVEDHIQFQLTGWFWYHQYPEGSNGEQIVKVDCQRGISATVNDPDSFVAMTSDWRGGAVRNGKGNLQKILLAAEKSGVPVKFELTKPKMDFGKDHGFTLTGGDVWRITDADLR